MRQSKGGMQSLAVQPSIICPKCFKPAFAMKQIGEYIKYSHFTKKGSVHHYIGPEGNTVMVKREKLSTQPLKAGLEREVMEGVSAADEN